MASAQMDKYANMLVKSVVQTAANTLTYSTIEIGLSLFDKVGLKIQRIEYVPNPGSIAEMTTAADFIELGLCTSDTPTSLVESIQSVIHMFRLRRVDMGTAATGAIYSQPDVYDFSSLDGGGLIVTPKPLFIGIDTAGLASAASAIIRIFFVVIKLSGTDYFELLETRHYFGQ